MTSLPVKAELTSFALVVGRADKGKYKRLQKFRRAHHAEMEKLMEGVDGFKLQQSPVPPGEENSRFSAVIENPVRARYPRSSNVLQASQTPPTSQLQAAGGFTVTSSF